MDSPDNNYARFDYTYYYRCQQDPNRTSRHVRMFASTHDSHFDMQQLSVGIWHNTQRLGLKHILQVLQWK
jgi:hypothetical protein